MSNHIEYSFYNGEYITTIDRNKKTITTNERGGWSRSYVLTFEQLLDDAKQWEVSVDLNQDDETIAKIGTNIILANHAVAHNLDPFVYVPKTKNITDPRDKKILQKFEKLLEKYDPKYIIIAMKEDKKEILKNALIYN